MKIKVKIDQRLMTLFGTAVANHIRERTLEGKDKDGKPFKQYSTISFAMPSGAMTQVALKALEKGGNLTWFTTKSGSEWVIVKGGYKKYKEVAKPKSKNVNLSFKGTMLADLTLINVKDDSISIGFNRSEEAQKAVWNIERGRDFFGIEENELSKLGEDLLPGVDVDIEE